MQLSINQIELSNSNHPIPGNNQRIMNDRPVPPPPTTTETSEGPGNAREIFVDKILGQVDEFLTDLGK